MTRKGTVEDSSVREATGSVSSMLSPSRISGVCAPSRGPGELDGQGSERFCGVLRGSFCLRR